ncbi:hypothetical protein PUNSTDRAFT_67240 [Punctularia strigosozonata HHB-11173 SS5]|uniref:uncharacterized protein n=1 Tax=Punctularia strigosozonata (strain HHB-11173) TaxID=741275 RepID=UPI0004416E31|nr:uncharacterized protein PUNSTDRAFT_67240 [Punctularia strigosozonata HHB-11173 SS5]EIN09100.1 hypothetical protein PUNSTDRAFT_67240 [Punctularia strigosozonata HHB-11173 SS5]
MYVARQEVLSPSGVEFATSLNLTPSTTWTRGSDATPNDFVSRVLTNLVVARSHFLRVFEVWQELAPASSEVDHEREKRAKVRKGTEAVEGEVAMDEDGEGFINVGQSIGESGIPKANTVARLRLVREHRLHGMVTGLGRIKILSSLNDGLDRLLISFEDAKIAVLEWSEEQHDLLTVSIHTYERAPQLMSLNASLFHGWLRVDPISRCAALALPCDAFAIIPFHQTLEEAPYAPSFILDLTSEVDQRIHNVVDMSFLPGFNNPTVAVLFQPTQTWTGRLTEYKDTMKLLVFTLDAVTRNYPVITSVDNLPYDCLSVHACSAAVGGVIVITSNSIIHVSQSSRRVALSVNGWASRVTDMSLAPVQAEYATRNLALEGSRLAFVDDRTFFLFLKDGTVYPVELSLDGAVVSTISMGHALAQSAIPAVVTPVTQEHIFVGSTAGTSVLLKITSVEEEVEDNASDAVAAAVVDTADSMVMDDDDDIYGVSMKTDAQSLSNGHANGTHLSVKKRSVTHLSLSDSLPGYGSISDMSFSLAKNGEKVVPELVAATGSGSMGGFTLFQRDLPARTKRKLHAIGGGRGMWSLSLRPTVKVNGTSYERAVNPFQADNDTVVVSTDANPAPGLSRFSHRTPRTEISITTRVPGQTIGAAPFFQRTAILHVMSNAIRVLEPDGSERQVIKDLDGNMARPKIRHCSICDPFVLIVREDDTIGLFIGESERGKIRRKDMSPMGDKTSRYLTGCFFTDNAGVFDLRSQANGNSGADKTATSTLQGVVNADSRSQWLLLVRPQGVLEASDLSPIPGCRRLNEKQIWTLPKLSIVFSVRLASTLDWVLADSGDGPALSMPGESPRRPQELDVEQAVIAPLGETAPQPHLLLFLRSGQLAIYQAIPMQASSVDESLSRPSLGVRFAKVATRVFEIQRQDDSEKSILAEQKKISRVLIPFLTSPSPTTTFSGVFFTGDHPCWILKPDRSGIRIHPSGHSVVHAFTSCSLWESKGDFLLYSDEGPSLLEWMPDTDVETELPSRSIPQPRSYSKVTFDASTGLIVAAAHLEAEFATYDEDNNIVWEPDSANVSFPRSSCSTLELISPDEWITMDGFEFANNEFVTSVESVPLETSSTESGSKDFIAVGTTIDRGEDLAVRGTTYVFEIVEVVPPENSSLSRWWKLRLRCRDDAKGPVTALCAMDGYLVSSMGQKIFVRAFDMDERLVGVAFLDVGVYVTTLRAVKNLLVIGDAAKSVWFVGFQEDPYKLVILAKDFQTVCVTTADFIFTEDSMSILTNDENGVMRLYQYDPQDPDSRNGQQLMCRTEFDTHTTCQTSIVFARRVGEGEEAALPQAKVVAGSIDGSLAALTCMDEPAFKRLQLLQGQLTRNIQHVAGLNPKAFRIVRNDYVSKPLSKGILDGNLLSSYLELPIPRQEEITKQIATERAAVLRDWTSIGSVW